MKIETTRTVRVATEGRVETWQAGEIHDVDDALAAELLGSNRAIIPGVAPVASEPEADDEPRLDFAAHDDEAGEDE